MAMTCGHTGLRARARLAQIYRELLKEYLPLPRGQVPSCPTRQRLSKGIDFTPVIHGFNEWRSQELTAERIAIDGNSLTSTVSSSQETDQSLVSLISFFSQPRQLILQVGAFENHQTSEISVVPELLNQFEITKAVFTLDAWHCQKTTVQALIKSGNHYVITVNQNQPKRHTAIVKPTPTTPPGATWSWTQTGPGHTVKCRLQVYSAPAAMKSQWTGW